PPSSPFLFFFRAPPTTHLSTLSLHDALPISSSSPPAPPPCRRRRPAGPQPRRSSRSSPALASRASRRLAGRPMQGTIVKIVAARSEEHTSELQSQSNLVCRLLLEKKKKKKKS